MFRKIILVLIFCLPLVVTNCVVSKKDYVLKEEEANKSAAALSQKVEENELLKSELSMTQGSLMDAVNARDNLAGELETVSQERDDLQADLEAKIILIDELRDQNERLGDLLKSKEVSQSQIIQETMSINKRLQDTNAELREKMVRGDTEIKRLSGERVVLVAKVASLNREIDELSRRREEELEKLKATYDELVSGLKNEIEAGEIQIRRMQDRLSVNLVEQILFDSGRADLKSHGIEVLTKVGAHLQKIEDKRIQIEGHTDNDPIGGRLKEIYPTNWELSASRALAVVHFLQDKVGIDGMKLSGAGYGEFQPVASNDAPESKAANRRIEIVLLAPYQKVSEAKEATEPTN
jgi:chemotaxis protein MotB